MTVDDCYQLGYVIKPHGLKGEVQVYLDVDSPEEYQTLESVFVLKGQQLVPFFIKSMAVRGEKAIVAFEEIETIEDAVLLKGAGLFLSLDQLPSLGDDGFYYHELVGFSLQTAEGKSIGEIKNVLDAGAQDLLSVMHTEGKEILIPLSDELIAKLDKEAKVLVMTVPDGLVDVYLSEES